MAIRHLIAMKSRSRYCSWLKIVKLTSSGLIPLGITIGKLLTAEFDSLSACSGYGSWCGSSAMPSSALRLGPRPLRRPPCPPCAPAPRARRAHSKPSPSTTTCV